MRTLRVTPVTEHENPKRNFLVIILKILLTFKTFLGHSRWHHELIKVEKNTPGLERYIHEMYVELNGQRTIGRTISSTKVSTTAGMLHVSEVMALFF